MARCRVSKAPSHRHERCAAPLPHGGQDRTARHRWPGPRRELLYTRVSSEGRLVHCSTLFVAIEICPQAATNGPSRAISDSDGSRRRDGPQTGGRGHSVTPSIVSVMGHAVRDEVLSSRRRSRRCYAWQCACPAGPRSRGPRSTERRVGPLAAVCSARGRTDWTRQRSRRADDRLSRMTVARSTVA